MLFVLSCYVFWDISLPWFSFGSSSYLNVCATKIETVGIVEPMHKIMGHCQWEFFYKLQLGVKMSINQIPILKGFLVCADARWTFGMLHLAMIYILVSSLLLKCWVTQGWDHHMAIKTMQNKFMCNGDDYVVFINIAQSVWWKWFRSLVVSFFGYCGTVEAIEFYNHFPYSHQFTI